MTEAAQQIARHRGDNAEAGSSIRTGDTASAEHPRCPCCGQSVGDRDVKPLIWLVLNGGKERRLAETLMASFGEWVSTETVIAEVYGDSRPYSARKCINVFAFYAREKLKSVGLTIEGRRGGQKHGGYRMAWWPA